MIVPLALVPPSIVVRQEGERTVVDNGAIRLTMDRKSGRFDLAWGDRASIPQAAGWFR